MRKITKSESFALMIAGALMIAAAAAPGQQIVHEVKVVNVEIPVRVFRGEAFVDTLALEDFEILENGIPQTPDAVYLVRKTSVERRQGDRAASPPTARHFVLLFEMTEYQPEIERAMEYFLANVIRPGDELILVTPMRSYVMKSEALLRLPLSKVKSDLIAKVRADILIGSAEYVNLIRELSQILAGSLGLEEKLQHYRETKGRLENLRYVDEAQLLAFARFLKDREGPKHVFFFYQKEVVPKINAKELQNLVMANMDRSDIQFSLMENFDFFKRDVTFDVAAVQRAFSDSSIAVHFLYLTRTRIAATDITDTQISNLVLEEQSEDIFSAFSEVARATGGWMDSAATASAAFQRAVDASETYYLLYYRPRDYRPDGTFRTLTVRVKGGGVRVSHRMGYFAN